MALIRARLRYSRLLANHSRCRDTSLHVRSQSARSRWINRPMRSTDGGQCSSDVRYAIKRPPRVISARAIATYRFMALLQRRECVTGRFTIAHTVRAARFTTFPAIVIVSPVYYFRGAFAGRDFTSSIFISRICEAAEIRVDGGCEAVRLP